MREGQYVCASYVTKISIDLDGSDKLLRRAGLMNLKLIFISPNNYPSERT